MTGKQLKNSILQWAIQGKLVPQDPNDEPASVLLEKIRAEKARLIKEWKIKKDKKESIIYRGEDNSYYEKFADGLIVCIDDEVVILRFCFQIELVELLSNLIFLECALMVHWCHIQTNFSNATLYTLKLFRGHFELCR